MRAPRLVAAGEGSGHKKVRALLFDGRALGSAEGQPSPRGRANLSAEGLLGFLDGEALHGLGVLPVVGMRVDVLGGFVLHGLLLVQTMPSPAFCTIAEQ